MQNWSMHGDVTKLGEAPPLHRTCHEKTSLLGYPANPPPTTTESSDFLRNTNFGILTALLDLSRVVHNKGASLLKTNATISTLTKTPPERPSLIWAVHSVQQCGASIQLSPSIHLHRCSSPAAFTTMLVGQPPTEVVLWKIDAPASHVVLFQRHASSSWKSMFSLSRAYSVFLISKYFTATVHILQSTPTSTAKSPNRCDEIPASLHAPASDANILATA